MNKLEFDRKEAYYTELPGGVKVKAEYDPDSDNFEFFWKDPETGAWDQLVEVSEEGKETPLTASYGSKAKETLKHIAYGIDLTIRLNLVDKVEV